MNDYKVGAYLRISQSDSNSESNSISNQKKLIRNYIKNNDDLQSIKFYVDDGYTGTNFNRPKFKKLYMDAISGKIKIIIVKDLSRLGRNYLQLGKYLNEFSSFEIRIIAINDGIDTGVKNKNNSILIPIKNILNDSYTRDISRKIKTSLDTKKKNGEFVGAFSCYGYKKDATNKNKLVVDKEASNVVKKIFDLAMSGVNFSEIAKSLNASKVLSPLMYKRKILNCNMASRWRNKENSSLWSQTAVSRILQNEVYCGCLIQRSNGKEILIKNTHEAIIDQDFFNKIQEKCFDRRGSHLFSNTLKCGYCNKSMIRYPSNDKYIYYCSSYRKSKRKECQPIKIKGDLLEISVFVDVKKMISLIFELKKMILNVVDSEKNWKVEMHRKMLKQLKNKFKEKNYIKNELLSDYKNGILSKEDYLFFSNEISMEVSFIEERIKVANDVRYFDWIDLFLKYSDCQVLNCEVLNNLIKNIYVYENSNIKIEFKYEEEYNEIIDNLFK